MRILELPATGGSQYIQAKDVEAISIGVSQEPPSFRITLETDLTTMPTASYVISSGKIVSALVRRIPELAEVDRSERVMMVGEFIKEAGKRLSQKIAGDLFLLIASDKHQYHTNPESYFGSVEIIDIVDLLAGSLAKIVLEKAEKEAKKRKS